MRLFCGLMVRQLGFAQSIPARLRRADTWMETAHEGLRTWSAPIRVKVEGLNPDGVVSSSPGLPLRLPWETMVANISNPEGVVSAPPFAGGIGHRELTQPRLGLRLDISNVYPG